MKGPLRTSIARQCSLSSWQIFVLKAKVISEIGFIGLVLIHLYMGAIASLKLDFSWYQITRACCTATQ